MMSIQLMQLQLEVIFTVTRLMETTAVPLNGKNL